ncbi:MAG: glutamine synthetase type III [Planctomycetes bacterium]|nr:glutamine synthetase type III [Planctomycetota bacterium]
MSSNRRQAVASIVQRPPLPTSESPQSLTELYGRNVFGDRAMRERLPASCYEAMRDSIERGTELDPRIADLVANAMKEWAVERGATHYTHWFQPMTGLTAEKHDSFISFSGDRLLLEFSGSELIKGEPDASSFPSGGIRQTFEARGYTAWDPTSPAFIREGRNGAATLCIPTAFCSWTGEALDSKTPLLRSNEALSKASIRMLRLLGDERVESVWATLGSEQEYFLIDRNFFVNRPDLVATGRTLLGARPPKGQELDDHYFGTISPRVLDFMEDSEHELWKLGVPIKTRHNEVAPSQFEVAHIYERSTVATDHNMLTMDVLRNAAARHGFVCLLHEKPFAGVNGSGKHNNWSLATDSGDNLLDPGDTPADNARFLVFLSAVIRAVDKHADLLRISIASAGNDHRLGANEAPPAIISIYLGVELDAVCQGLIAGVSSERYARTKMQLGVTSLPPLPRDTTDRNRTSPFAFTGNKFEFRAVGSSQSVAMPNIFLNTMVAESLNDIADEIEKADAPSREDAVQKVLQETLRAHYRVVFNGNNYADEWYQEAEKRGLPNHRTTPEALAYYLSDKNVNLFESLGVYSQKELEARRNVAYENYSTAIAIEAQSCLGLAQTAVLPAALKQQEQTARSLAAARAADGSLDLGPQEGALKALSTGINALIKASQRLQKAVDAAEDGEHDVVAHSEFVRDKVFAAMAETREACDALETMIGDETWPLPKYREMLFIH